LVGLAALLIASKYEDIYPPDLKDVLATAKGAYSRAQLLETECKILQTVEYSIIESSPYRFLERFSKIAKADAEVFSIAQCLLEMALFDSKMN